MDHPIALIGISRNNLCTIAKIIGKDNIQSLHGDKDLIALYCGKARLSVPPAHRQQHF